MRQTRMHVAQPLAVGASIVLDPVAAEHAARVLRLRAGDTVVLFNGDGSDYPARLQECTPRRAVAEVLGVAAAASESPLRVVLAQALVSGNKMDLVIQKAVELGVHAIVPLEAQRSGIQLDAARAARRLEHWQAIVRSACGQCGRARVPEVIAPVGLAAWCRNLKPEDGLRLALLPGAGERPRDLPSDTRAAVLVVGPEGGLAREEIALLEEAGFRGLALGPRILRTETAGLAALAALQARCGDL